MLVLALTGYGGLLSREQGGGPAAGTGMTAPAPDSTKLASESEPSPSPDQDGIVIDKVNMAEFPCHRMGSTIMGQCNDADVKRFRDEIFFMRTAQAKSTVGTPEPAAGQGTATTTSISSAASDDPPSPGGGLTPDSGADIVVDPKAMADFPCHAMGNVIMGRCTGEEIEQLKSEIVALRSRSASQGDAASTVATRTPALRLPGVATGGTAVPPAATSEVVRLSDGDEYRIDAIPVVRRIGAGSFPGYAYNGQIPGPTLRVKQGTSVNVELVNKLDMPTTIHWHGLRQDAGSDGVPGLTQLAVLPGERFMYALTFPDAGVYWYHPHIREDIQQDAGLYGVIIVDPADAGFFNPVSREAILVLDDLLVEDGALAPYGRDTANHVIMGRYGNVMLVNGRPDFALSVKRGEVVRFYLLNVANVRPFRVSFDGARIKRVGSDLGRYQRETWEESILIAPAERYLVEVLFDQAKEYRLLHTTSDRTYALGTIHVADSDDTSGQALVAFDDRRASSEVKADVERLASQFERPPDIELVLDVEIPGMLVAGGGSIEEGEHHDEAGVEWEDTMLEVNRRALGRDARWMIRDRRTGVANHDLAYSFKVGDLVKIRLTNSPDSKHPMQHPIHIHGQRFMVLSTNGHRTANPVWKDTVLVPLGATVDLVLEVTNTGTWMVHCHIAEHLENGMMFNFTVTDGKNAAAASSRPGTPAPSNTAAREPLATPPAAAADSHEDDGGHP